MAQNRISQLRKSLGLTQRALAELAGTSQQQVQRIEAGIQGVRLELATKIADALGSELADIFPSLAKDQKRKNIDNSRVPSQTKFMEAGLDPDPRRWSVDFYAHDGRIFSYELASDEQFRLQKIVQRPESDIMVFASKSMWVALNPTKIAATQFLYDLWTGDEGADADSDDKYELKLHLIGAKDPVSFDIEPDALLLDDDEHGNSSQLQRLFSQLEMGLDDEAVWFDDADGEPVYIRPKEFLVIEVPLICCEPVLQSAQSNGYDEDEFSNLPSSRSEEAGK